MKKLIFLLALIPAIAHAQHLELGINTDGGINVTAALRLHNHIKVGVGYEYALYTSTALFGGGVSWKTQTQTPFCYAAYYSHVKKHEFYGGVDIGMLNVVQYTNYDGDVKEHGVELGIHGGYSRKLIKGLYANGQLGIDYMHVTSTYYTGNGGIIKPTIGLHYIF